MNMAYNNRFVITVLQNDRIMKELANGSVPIEFGEYKIRLRNKHNRRAICRLSIDGENVSAGGFIIPANSFIDIERNADVAKKFKFVSLDSEEAQDFGKDGSNHDKVKGTIVAEFALEKEKLYTPFNTPTYVTNNHYHYGTPKWVGSINMKYGAAKSFNSLNGNLDDSFSYPGKSCSYASSLGEIQNLQDGATVEGSHSNQNFSTTYFDYEDNWTSIRIFLQGYEKKPEFITTDSNKPAWETINLPKPFTKDEELMALEKELLELQKQKARKEIEKLKAELA
jgi:hypothetical protein